MGSFDHKLVDFCMYVTGAPRGMVIAYHDRLVHIGGINGFMNRCQGGNVWYSKIALAVDNIVSRHKLNFR